MPRILILLCGLWFCSAAWADSGGKQTPPAIPMPREGKDSVYDITVHDPAQMTALLERLQALSHTPNPASHLPRIALVLHGPEVNFFAIRNYPRYRELVDLAARLDAFQLIEVKACQTRMREQGLGADDLPGFIELVPFGPDEVDKLNRRGAERYVYM